jgi:prepilin-type N-terminal cleavage/methylation domain-containing protein
MRPGFSLAEVLAALTIGSMVLVAILTVYSRAEKSAAAVMRHVDSGRLPSEVLQLIAEDLDAIVSADTNTKITIDGTKFDNGFQTSELVIHKTVSDEQNEEQTFEQITWQAVYDTDVGALTLYRGHSGFALEDKLLDEKRDSLERLYPFIPICTGVTFFQIQVPRGENMQDRWTSAALPPGVTATISFAEPELTVQGTLDVLEEDKISRTIAIDRTRKIRFKVEIEPDQQNIQNEQDEQGGQDELKEQDRQDEQNERDERNERKERDERNERNAGRPERPK